MNQGATARQIVVSRRTRWKGRLRLNIALEAHDCNQQSIDLLVGEVEVRHAELVEGLEHPTLVEHARIVQLPPEPGSLRRVRDVADESEVETGDQLAAFLGQVGAYRLCVLEALDLVAG